MNLAILLEPNNLLLYAKGLLATLELTGLSLFIGGAAAVPLALLRNSAKFWVSKPIWFFTYIIRGTPLLIQVYLIYYGIAQLNWIQARWDTVWPWAYFKEPFFCVILAFSLNTCAYTLEMLAGAIRETPAGEIEAAKAAGFSDWKMMYHLVLPSAFRRVLPGYSNEVIMMLHSTSVASVVPALLDLTGAARTIYSDYFLPFEAFIAAGFIYFCVTYTIVFVFKRVEYRYLAYMRPRTT